MGPGKGEFFRYVLMYVILVLLESWAAHSPGVSLMIFWLGNLDSENNAQSSFCAVKCFLSQLKATFAVHLSCAHAYLCGFSAKN